jgi:hypothetical protein
MNVEIMEIGDTVKGICQVIGTGEVGKKTRGSFGFSVAYNVHEKKLGPISFHPRKIVGRNVIMREILVTIKKDQRENPSYYI